MKSFKVKFNIACEFCGKPITENRFRTYCSTICREKFTYRRDAHKRPIYQKRYKDKRASIPSPDKLQCLICNQWYIQVASHVFQRHKMTSREYKAHFDLPLSRGVAPKLFRIRKGEQAIENKTYLNLENGAKDRYIKGGEKQKTVSGWKGRNGSKGFTDY